MAPPAKKPTPKSAKKKVPTVPETLAAKAKRKAATAAARAAGQKKAEAKARAARRIAFKRAAVHLIKHKKHQRAQIQLHREAAKVGSFYVPDEPKLAFVVRIRGINQIHPRVRKILQLLRLRQINNGVFVKLNKATINMLRIAEPQIAWGYPSMKTVHDLVYKRGHAKVDKRRVPITSNSIVEKSLGKHDIVCVEDLVSHIYNVGPNFKEASNFLWPFKLNTPLGGWTKKTNHFVENGDFGNREHHINRLLARMI